MSQSNLPVVGAAVAIGGALVGALVGAGVVSCLTEKKQDVIINNAILPVIITL